MLLSAPRPLQGHVVRSHGPARWAAVFFAAGLVAGEALAVVRPELPSELAERAFRHPDLDVRSVLVPGTETGGLGEGLAALGAPAESAYFDLRSGRWASLLPAAPLVPGDGAGNDLSWAGLGVAVPRSEAELADAAWRALSGWIGRHAGVLGIDPAELGPRSVAVHDGGALIQVSGRRVIGGIPVRDAGFTAVVGRGNLVLFGTRDWGEPSVATVPAVASDLAEAAVGRYLGELASGGRWRPPHLELVPVAAGGDGVGMPAGGGPGYRLVWVISPELRAGLPGAWEALVDAASGEILALADTHVYLAAGGPAVRGVTGGHLPLSNDGVPPGGVEEAGAPVPYADLEVGGQTLFTDGGGNLLQCIDGEVTSQLAGRLAAIDEGCGAISESTTDPILDFGTNEGTDCATPPGASPGNTRAARTAYYELSRIKETALGQLPGNAWLAGQLTAITNVPASCGAFWNGTTVQFYRAAAGGACANPGELAAVIAHEWGHGLDDNGVNPSISSPSEGIPDVYAALRLHDSCIGRGFFSGGNCGGYGDPCVACSGVRDVDWANRSSGAPHDLPWIDANCPSGGDSPCGGLVHCEGAAVSEALWDLYRRDLQGFDGSAFDFDDDTAAEIASRLIYLGSGPVGGWFDCIAGNAGCAADTGYLNFLAADDDDGDLGNGTPHMSAIFAAFDRLGIACPTPAVQDSGCAGTPATPPVVSVAPLDRGVHLTWDPVAGASGYEVFRTEGPVVGADGCDFGKVALGVTAGTEWIDVGLQNGRTYRYVVIPKGPGAPCFGNGSACTPATPAPGPRVGAGAIELTFLNGDGDPFVDNCEALLFDVAVENLGTGLATGLEILDVSSPSHPGTVVVDPLPIALPGSLAECAAAGAALEVRPAGLAHDDTLLLEITVDSAEMPFPAVRTIAIAGTESDPSGVPDLQPDVCPVFADGFEGGNVARWTSSVP